MDTDADADAEPEPDGSDSRDALRDAVAAWVATADEPSDTPEPEPTDPAPAADSASAAPEPAPADSDRTTALRAVKPAPADSAPAAPEAGPADSERTAVFRAVRPTTPKDAPADSASAASTPAPTAEAAPSADADSAPAVADDRTAAFRAVKPAPADSAPAAPEAAPADSERTAVFRAVRPTTPKAAPADSASAAPTPAPADEAAPSADADSAPAAPEAGPADSASVSGPVDEPVGGDRAAKPAAVERPADSASAQPKAAPADEAADSERTAVFRAVRPDAPVKEPAPRERTGVFRIPAVDADAEAGDSERTAVFRAVKPAAPADSASAPPKASTFVPLRTDEPGEQEPKATPKATPKPTAKAPAPAPAPASMDRSERTTQQPLPPKPPLDMLADLTNNPPPPPSPLRTAIRRFKIYFPLAVLLAIILAVVQLVRPLPEPKLVMTEKSSYTFGGTKPELPWPSEGQAYMAAAGLGTLGQSGEQKPVPIASVTKSMTAYIILRDHPIKKGEQGQMIDVDKQAETEGKKNDSVNNESTLDTVKEGDKISEYDAIAALMIPSANNIARLLARWDAGSQEAFVKKMNDTAKELGMANTTYTDPSGLDATTVSTAEDQVKLGLKLVEIEALLDITKKPSWVDPSGKSWRNWNGLVPYNESLGIKTGTTTKAGGNLLFAAQKKIGNTNQLIVGAVLGQHKPPIIDSVLAASKQLMIATQKALEGAPVVKKGTVVGYVDDGLGGRTPVVATADVQAVGWASLTVNVKLADGGGKIPQTAKAGTEIGVLTVGEGASQVKVPVALQSELAAPGIGGKLTRVG
ncbi:D-alanyl-D-alanine carboxypeptidase family protein [Streptomyces sp. LARHCF249]